MEKNSFVLFVWFGFYYINVTEATLLTLLETLLWSQDLILFAYWCIVCDLVPHSVPLYWAVTTIPQLLSEFWLIKFLRYPSSLKNFPWLLGASLARKIYSAWPMNF